MLRHIILLALSIVVALFCQSCKPQQGSSKLLEGDFYYSFFQVGSLYNQPDSIANKVRLYADTAQSKYMQPDEL